MIYGVPQNGKCSKTNRVKKLKLEAETGADEIFLTKLVAAFDRNDITAIKIMTTTGKAECSLIFENEKTK